MKTSVSKKKIQDSIAITKGYHKIHNQLMFSRKFSYILLIIESILIIAEIICASVFYIHHDLEDIFYSWLIISLGVTLFLVLGQCNFLFLVQQYQLKLVIYLSLISSLNLLAANITQGFVEKDNEKSVYVSSLIFGFVIFLVQSSNFYLFFKKILSVDLTGKGNLIKRAILSKQVGKDSQYLQHTFITDGKTGDLKSENIENASDDFFNSDKSEDEAARETPNHEESFSN